MRGVLATYGGGVAGGAVAAALQVPLPWLLGPLFATGAAAALGQPRSVVPGSRQAGQAIVGVTLGLYFTRDVLGTLAAALPWMIAAGAATIAAALAGARLLRRLAGLGPATAFYASVPGGAAEMAVLGERDGGDPAVIALSQALRVAAVVSVLPFAFTLAGVHGEEVWAPAARGASVGGLGAVGLLGLAAALATQALGVPNAWLLGPLAASALLTASGAGAAGVPRPLVDAAQVAIGCALGSRFRRELLRDAWVLLPPIALVVAQGMALLAAFAAAIAGAAGRPASTLLLATAPGGIAEMCLTARTLQLGVPLVTAFHVLRLVLLLTCAPAAFRLWCLVDPGTPRQRDERSPSP